MGGLFIIIARALIAAPFLASGVCGVVSFQGQSQTFSEVMPQAPWLFPVVLGVKLIVSVVLVLGLPLHRSLAVVAALFVLMKAALTAPFWHFIGPEEAEMMTLFALYLAHAGGLVLIGAMPKS